MLVGVLLQAPWIFLVLGGVLWWNAVLPRWNLFDALYNWGMAGKPGYFALAPAPAPRRFAQGMAGTFALAIGTALLRRWQVTAIVLETFLILAIAALVFGSFCFGSFVYHLLRGRLAFARRTSPWAQGD